jgi:heavy metal efflux system protein
MLLAIVRLSVQFRFAVAGGLLALLAGGLFAARTLPIDALPDVSTVQVTIMTRRRACRPSRSSAW